MLEFSAKHLDIEDKSAHVGCSMLNFGKKEIIFSDRDRWYYRLSGDLKMPTSPSEYCAHRKKNEWAVTKDIRKLLAWVDEEEVKDKK